MDSAVYHGPSVTPILTHKSLNQIWLTGLTSVPPASRHPPCSAPAPGWRSAVESSGSLACRRLTQAQLGACDRTMPELAAASRDQPLPACKPVCDLRPEAISMETPSTRETAVIWGRNPSILPKRCHGMHGSSLQICLRLMKLCVVASQLQEQRRTVVRRQMFLVVSGCSSSSDTRAPS